MSPSLTWFSIMGDAAADMSSNEQIMNTPIRCRRLHDFWGGRFSCWITSHVFEHTCDHAEKNVLTRCNLWVANCRGQEYDGATHMQGNRNGVASHFQSEFPTGYSYPSVLAHCLKLTFQEAGRKWRSLTESLELVKEIAKLIKPSPKGSTLSSRNLANYEVGVTLKYLCPTRWRYEQQHSVQ